jgi:SAM-dependent methyltransferase
VTQAIRGKKKREAREFDKTSLRANSHGLWIHRDYAAHFFRWGFAKRFIGPRTRVLDVGCGVEAPLVNVLTPSLSHVPRSYVGVDLGRLPGKTTPSRQWATYYGRFDATEIKEIGRLKKREREPFDVIVCLEVIEHMTKPAGLRLLKNLTTCRAPGGLLLLSTPVFDGKAARNHLHEYTLDELARSIERAGWQIEDRFGTFARQRDLKDVATPQELAVVKQLKRYYDDDVIACFLAPLYPDVARNNIWLLRRPDDERPPPPPEGPKTRRIPDKGRRPKKSASLGIGVFIRECILLGDDTERVLKKTHRKFAGRTKATASDVAWNRRRLRKEGKL